MLTFSFFTFLLISLCVSFTIHHRYWKWFSISSTNTRIIESNSLNSSYFFGWLWKPIEIHSKMNKSFLHSNSFTIDIVNNTERNQNFAMAKYFIVIPFHFFSSPAAIRSYCKSIYNKITNRHWKMEIVLNKLFVIQPKKKRSFLSLKWHTNADSDFLMWMVFHTNNGLITIWFTI